LAGSCPLDFEKPRVDFWELEKNPWPPCGGTVSGTNKQNKTKQYGYE